MLNMLKKILPHIVIILCGIFITFLILDMFNPNMNFTGNSVSKILLAVLCVAGLAEAIMCNHNK